MKLILPRYFCTLRLTCTELHEHCLFDYTLRMARLCYRMCFSISCDMFCQPMESAACPWIVKLDWLEGGCNLGAVRYGFPSSAARGWLVIFNQSCLIGIWLGKSQISLLSHPNRINSLAIIEMWNKGGFRRKKVHTFHQKWIHYKQRGQQILLVYCVWKIVACGSAINELFFVLILKAADTKSSFKKNS